MEYSDILQAIVEIHNQLAEVSVRGDDTIRMSNVLQQCRSLVFQLQKALNESQDTE